ncbi:hypothetical protein PYW07_009998 [Mythimna separata]|uniref:Cytochrome P450 n=1 Tax=Mythimna separata TaxID=271217 RepID=A0AAD8DPZ0_MYTSE|nr:hypothetical protein PYW07_009998 [Mythimna separata]
MLGIVVVCLILWICALVYLRDKLVNQGHPLPPAYPGMLPIIGHTHLLLTDTINIWLRLKKMCQYSIQQGGVICCKFGFDIYYLITDPEDALVVANTCLDKLFLYSFGKYWLGDGLITGSGDHWHRHRQMLRSSFSLSIINGYLDVFNSQARILLKGLEGSLEEGSFYPIPHLKHFALRSSYLTTFGKTVNDEATFPKYLKATDGMLKLAMERFQKFWLHNDYIHALLGYKKKENELVACTNKISDEIIQTKRAILNKVIDKTAYVPFQPLIHLMLEQHTSNPFNDQEISEELHTAVVAAFDTTSRSLQSIFLMIGSFPKVQERMYEEIMEVVGKDRDVHKDDLRKLVYTGAVIKESMRLIPTVPVIGRYIDKDVKLSKTWAMTAMKIAVSHVVRKFVITADYTKLQSSLELTLKAASGHDISLKLRN